MVEKSFGELVLYSMMNIKEGVVFYLAVSNPNPFFNVVAPQETPYIYSNYVRFSVMAGLA